MNNHCREVTHQVLRSGHRFPDYLPSFLKELVTLWLAEQLFSQIYFNDCLKTKGNNVYENGCVDSEMLFKSMLLPPRTVTQDSNTLVVKGPGLTEDFLLWIIFKVFTESVTILLLFYVLDWGPPGTCDLSSKTKDGTRNPCTERRSPNTWITPEGLRTSAESICY